MSTIYLPICACILYELSIADSKPSPNLLAYNNNISHNSVSQLGGSSAVVSGFIHVVAFSWWDSSG